MLVRLAVGVLDGVRLGVRVGALVLVAVGSISLLRVRVGGAGVQVINARTVTVLEGVIVGEGVIVTVGVVVGMNSEMPSTVRAATVLMGFEKPESTMSRGSISGTTLAAGLDRAAADTRQIRLKPKTPAARTVSGAVYSRSFTLSSFLLSQMMDGSTSTSEQRI